MLSTLGLFLPFVFFICLNSWLVTFAKKDFGQALPVTMLLTPMVLYLSQFVFKTFKVGDILLLVLALAGIVMMIIKMKKDETIKERFFSYGFFCFIAIGLLFMVIDFRRFVTSWDELSHWGKMVKEMLRLDSFYSVAESDLIVHKDYPPFVSLFELLWCKLALGYSESAVSMGLHVFEFSLLGPWMVEKLKKAEKLTPVRKIVISLFVVVLLGILILDFDSYGTFNSIYTDIVMPIMFAYGLTIIIDKEEKGWFNYFALVLVAVALMLTKQMSIAFVALLWLGYSINVFFLDKSDKAPKTIAIKAAKSLGILVIPMVFHLQWSAYIKSLEIVGQFNTSSISIGELVSIILGGGNESQHEAFKLYVNSLHTTILSTGCFELTYVSSLVFAYVLLYVMHLIFKDIYKKGYVIRDCIIFLFGGVGYAVTMLALYMFCFVGSEQSGLASFTRYMGSYVVSEYLVIALILVWILSQKNWNILQYKILIPTFGVLLLTANSANLEALSAQMFEGETLCNARFIAERFEANSSEDETMLYVGSKISYGYYINYYLNGRNIDDTYIHTNISEISSENTTAWEQVAERIKIDGYVFVDDANGNVTEALKGYSADGTITSQTLYKATVENDKLVLTAIQ